MTAAPDTTQQIVVMNRWTSAVQTRRSSPRAVPAVRARIAHTSVQKCRLDIFVTEPVHSNAGWALNGLLHADFLREHDQFLVRLTPSHSGLKAMPNGPRSKTVRVAISGAPILTGICAKVRDVPFKIDGATLVARLPLEWALEYRAMAEAEAAKVTAA